ncbi:MAG: Yip1 family protein [Gammaproteobacteria bacterium]|nr:Yip1 family protein [Gammaproteobacteria bacterium]
MERLWKILISPRQEFDEMREDVSILLPLMTILLVAGICGAITVMMTPDQVFIDAINAQADAQEQMGQTDNAQELRDQMENPNMVTLARTVGVVSGFIGAPIVIVIGLLILGTFFFIVGKIVGSDTGWVDWFGFSCWVSIPTAVGAILSVVLVAIGGMDWQNGLELLGWFGMNAPWAAAITIPSLWTLYITVNGLDSWLSKGAVVSVVVALIPIVFAMLVGSLMGNVQQSLQSMGLG